jgi:HEAT repeat protein/energy-coupling factor transporter ATP-binding protein EcfA2
MNPELTMEQCYRDHLTRIYNRLSLTALPERDPGVKDLPLDKVFVKLNVVMPAPSPSAVSFRRFAELEEDGGEFATQRHFPRPVDGKDGMMEEWRWRQYREEVKAPPPVPISIATALQQHRHLVILGTPGSGKTTLLRWLAITFAQQQQAQPDRLGEAFSQERVPILLELRRFVSRAQHWIDSPGVFNLAKEICQWIDADARFAGITADWMSQVLTQQPCLLLLDGLDEIADLEARRRLLESLEAFSQNPQYEKVQCLLTSRFHGFQGIALGANFQQTEVHPFSEEDIALFIRHWYATAYADMAESQAEAQQLIEAIQVNSGVKELAQNPLLCTIVAIIYRNNRILPNRRVELYWKCCEALLDTWERNKAIRESGLIGGFDWQTKLELLMPVAYWFHEGNHGRLAVKEEAVVTQLAKSLEELRKRSGLSGGKPIEQEAREFIVAIRDRSGLLQGRGDGTLEFTHRTFQEYLAARYIAKQAEAVCIDWVMTHLHEEWWREVHLLVIGHLGSGGDTAEKATRLLLTILQEAYKAPSRWLLLPPTGWWRRWLDMYKSSWQERTVKSLLTLSLWLDLGTWLPRLQWQRRLAWLMLREFELVAQGYADCTPAGRTPMLTKALSDFAVKRVSQWQYNPFYWAQRSFVLDTLAKYALPREEVATFLLKGLLNNRLRVRRAAAYWLGLLGYTTNTILTSLVKALEDEDLRMRSVVARSLVCLGQTSEAIVPTLVKTLQDEDWFVRMEAAKYLGRLSQASEVVITALVKALRDEDEWVRRAAVESLERLGQAHEVVVMASVKALQNDDRGMRRKTAENLGDLGQATEEVVTALVEALQDDEESVCKAAADSLGRLGQIDELVKALQDDDWVVCRAAAANLIRLGQVSQEVVAVQVRALQDKNRSVRREATESLGQLKKMGGEELWTEVLIVLQQRLHDDDWGVRYAAFNSLRQLLAGKQIPGYRWRSLEERGRFWRRFKNPNLWRHLLMAVVAVLLGLGAVYSGPQMDSWVAELLVFLASAGVAYTILPQLPFFAEEKK